MHLFWKSNELDTLIPSDANPRSLAKQTDMIITIIVIIIIHVKQLTLPRYLRSDDFINTLLKLFY